MFVMVGKASFLGSGAETTSLNLQCYTSKDEIGSEMAKMILDMLKKLNLNLQW